MAGVKICPLFTVMMNRETVCFGERCAWAISEDASAQKSIKFEPVCCQWVIAAELRKATDQLSRLSQISTP